MTQSMESIHSNTNDHLPDTVGSLSKMLLWLNSGCNARCQSCDIWREPVGTNLSLEEVRTWAPQWKEMALDTVVICGEPLIYPDVWKILDVVRSYDIRVELLTNGLLLERNASNVAQYCDVVRVSLDGPEAIHNESRGRSNAFSRLQRGVTALHEQRSSLQVYGRCHVHKKNFMHMCEAVEDAKRIALSGISFSGTDFSNEEAFRRENTITADYKNSFAITGHELDALEVQLERLFDVHHSDFESGYISDSPARLRHLLLDYYREMSGDVDRPIRCNAPWTSVVLEYDGTIRPCFPMPAYGNVKDFPSLEAALNSESAKAFRSGLDVLNNSVCRRCVDQAVNTTDGNVP